uniref:Condensin complex subunit 3 n=1 Tax=Ditylenchus dipsaci TaxID=166011 RepID=A0A915EDC5_9BILA
MPVRKNRRQSLEKPANQEKESPEKHGIQASLCSHLKDVYFSKDEGSIKRAVEDMAELFGKVHKSRPKNKAFFDELKFRTDFLIDNKQSQTCRVRCLRAIAMLAIRLFKENKPEVLTYLVEYCHQLSDAESATIRQYICVLIHFLYKTCLSSNNENLKLCELLPQESYRQLFSVLKDRWLDVTPAVRRDAIRCLALIQDDEVSADHEEAMAKSPKESGANECPGDCSGECRQEAIKCLTMVDPAQTKLILTRVLKEPDWQVKKEALTKILSIQDTHTITSREKMDILDHLFGPSQHYLSEMACELLLHWVRLAANSETDEQMDQGVERQVEDNYVLFSGTLAFTKQLDPIKNEELCEKAVIIAMQNLAGEHRGLTDFVHTLTGQPESCIIHRNNYKCLLQRDIPLSEKAYLLFHWRCLLELCCLEYEHKEDQKSVCMYKLVPTLQAYAEFANEFVEFFGESFITVPMSVRGTKRKTEEEQRRFCLVQLFRIFHFMDPEPVGMKTWKELLLHVLSNTNIQLYPDLVQEIAESIVHVHYAVGQDVEAQALHEFCDVINMFVQKTANPNCTQALVNQTISITQPEDIEPQPPIALKMDEATRGRALVVLNSLLRTGKLTKITAELQGLHDTILPDSFGSKLPEERSLALECLGVICLMDEEWAVHNTTIVKQFISLDLTMVKYGQSKVSFWYQNNNKERRSSSTNSRNSLLASNMINTVLELSSSKVA